MQVGPGSAGLWESGPSDPVSEDFSAVALQGFMPEGDLIFEAAARSGSGWGPFASAGAGRYPNGRFWVRIPISGKKGAILRLRLTGAAAGPSAALEIFQAVLTPLRGEASAAGTDSGLAPLPVDGAVLDGVEPRSAWGARPATGPYEPMLPLRLTLHHTEMAQPLTRADAVTELRVIQDFHIQGRGWIDIGYHFLIDGSGRVWEGRPHSVIGAHVRNKNDGNVGIALLGNFHPPSAHRPTAAQTKAWLARRRCRLSMEPADPGAPGPAGHELSRRRALRPPSVLAQGRGGPRARPRPQAGDETAPGAGSGRAFRGRTIR